MSNILGLPSLDEPYEASKDERKIETMAFKKPKRKRGSFIVKPRSIWGDERRIKRTKKI